MAGVLVSTLRLREKCYWKRNRDRVWRDVAVDESEDGAGCVGGGVSGVRANEGAGLAGVESFVVCGTRVDDWEDDE